MTRLLYAYDVQLHHYPTPINVSYQWSYGSIAGIAMAYQSVTGLALVALYIADEQHVTHSIESINRDGVLSWLTRYTHSNGPSIIFVALYLHQSRSLFIGSRNGWAWLTGWVILLCTIITAFLGYSLVWQQMSYWAATVITSLITVLPYSIGSDVLVCIWGGPYIAQPTLSRFLAWHYILSIAVLALIVVHIVAVHHMGSSNPTQLAAVDKVPFMQYFVIKDAIGLSIAVLSSLLLIVHAPTALIDTELYMPINTMTTPAHIIPEWYLLPYYAVLRCVPDKVAGCIIAAVVLLSILTLPWRSE